MEPNFNPGLMLIGLSGTGPRGVRLTRRTGNSTADKLLSHRVRKVNALRRTRFVTGTKAVHLREMPVL